jgi:WD40 repeat protein
MTKIKVEKKATLAGHRDCVYVLEESPSDSIFFSAGGDGMVARWDLTKPEIGDLIIRVPNSIYALHCVKEKNQLIVGQNYEGIHLIDLEKLQEINSIKLTSSAIFDIKVIDNEAFVACGDGVVIVVNLDEMAVRKHLKASDKSARCLAFNPSQNEFAVGYSDNFIRIFDLEKLTLKLTIEAHKNSIFTVAYSPDYQWLISGSRDAHLKIWDVNENYTFKEKIVAHLYAINHLMYSPDGQHFATCSMDKSIKVWDSQSFKLLKVIDRARHAGHGTSVNKLWWSNYQHQLVSASDDRMISVWELDFLS